MAHSSLWRIAHQDPLTEIWNRRYADTRLAQEVSRAKRENGYKFSVILADVDNLKRINDDTGHVSGDEALRWVARFLKQGLRGHDLCCRLGGDEFLLVLPGSGESECGDLVARIRRRWQTAVAAGEPAVAISLGTASFPNQGTDVESLMVVADHAMYGDKRRGPRGRDEGSRPVDRISDAIVGSVEPAPMRGVAAKRWGYGNVVVQLRRLLLFLACVFGMTCATHVVARPYRNSLGRGLVVSAQPGAFAIVAGPVLLHAYSDTSGTRMYLAPAITGTDGDCALPPGVTMPEADQALRRNQSLVLAVPTGSVACAAAGEGNSVEILWHALAPNEKGGTITAQSQGSPNGLWPSHPTKR